MKFYIYTLGCKVNTYESNALKEILEHSFKYDKVSDIYIVNSCTVTNMALTKTLKLIRRINKEHPESIIIVMGCASQFNADKFINLKGVKIIIGNKNKTKVNDYIKEYLDTRKQIVAVNDVNNTYFEPMAINNFNQTRAYIKIEDGCNNFCTYCIIPYVRGRVCSKKPDIILKEVTSLVANGHQEIVLTGINTGEYGVDLDNYKLSNLLHDMSKINGLERIRISSIEITELSDEFLKELKDNKLIVDHLHIPIQSGSDKILNLMNRKYDINYFKDKIKQIRTIRPNISITTDLIVGFPNETEGCFNETIKNILDINFSKIHVFPFSLRKGTKAELLDNNVDDITKKRRVEDIIKISNTLENNYMNKFINQNVEVLIEEYKDGYLYGHTSNYLYIKVKGAKDLIHKSIGVNIVENEYPYLIANVVK